MIHKIKALIWNVDDIYDEIRSYYQAAVARGLFEIIGYRLPVKEEFGIFRDRYGKYPLTNIECDKIIISSENNFFMYRTELLSKGIPHSAIIDGRVFAVNGLDIKEFFFSGKALGKINDGIIYDRTCTIYSRQYKCTGLSVNLGKKSYIVSGIIEGKGNINIGNYSAISWQNVFELGLNEDHNPSNFTNYGMTHFDWPVSQKMYDSRPCSMDIGSDVWIGRGCRLKSVDPDTPLTIGNGAVIAADSVVVQSVPPYAIVGGNPAKIIRYRFNEDKIKRLTEIQWWNWDLEKIHAFFKENDVNKSIDDLLI